MPHSTVERLWPRVAAAFRVYNADSEAEFLVGVTGFEPATPTSRNHCYGFRREMLTFAQVL
jgi:hypothetical protein